MMMPSPIPYRKPSYEQTLKFLQKHWQLYSQNETFYRFKPPKDISLEGFSLVLPKDASMDFDMHFTSNAASVLTEVHKLDAFRLYLTPDKISFKKMHLSEEPLTTTP